MIDINELRRLAQAATPHVGHACKYQDAHWLREGHVDFENADLFIASERPQEDAAFYAAANPAAISELLDRLDAAESDGLEQARLNGMGASREAALMAKLEAAENERDALRAELTDLRSSMTFRTSLIGRIEAERDALRARIEAMERQEPVARTMGEIRDWVSNGDGTYSLGGCLDAFMPLPDETSLYALPGAKGEEK